MSKKIANNRRVKQPRTKLHAQEFKLGTFISKIFPEAYSGYPVSGQFYESTNR